MTKKDAMYILGNNENEVFTQIKQAITEVPALYKPNFNKDFFLYTFSSETSLAIVLTQKTI